MTEKKSVAVFGVGVGGLSVAHELSKNSRYNEIGGLARSGPRWMRDRILLGVYLGFYQNSFQERHCLVKLGVIQQ